MGLHWTQPVCDICWAEMKPGRVPVRYVPAEVEQCCNCGERTASGIYIRVDPRTVLYPQET